MSTLNSPYNPFLLGKRSAQTSFKIPYVRPPSSGKSISNISIVTSTKTPFGKNSLLMPKKNNSFLQPPSEATLRTAQDSVSNLSIRSKTPLDERKRFFSGGRTIQQSKAKLKTSNLLDMSSGATLPTRTASLSPEDLTHNNSLEYLPNPTKNYQTLNETIDISSIRRSRVPLKAIHLSPLDLKQSPGKFEKPSRSVEKEMDSYRNKVHAIDLLDSRRLRGRQFSEERSTIALACRESVSKISGLNNAEKGRLMSFSIDDEDYFQKVESLIFDTSKRIERDQRLNQVVELIDGKWIHMDTEKMEWRYCFVAVKGKPTPLEVFVKTPKGVKSLKIYVSKSQKKPSKGYHDFDFENKKGFKIYEKDKKIPVFNTRYLYFAFSLEVSGYVAVKISFPEPETQKRSLEQRSASGSRDRKLKMRFLTEGNDEVSFQKDVERMKEIMNERKPSQQKSGPDIIAMNRNLEKFTIAAKTQIQQIRKNKLDIMIKKTLENKEEILKQRHKQSFIKSIKKDVQKGLKDLIQADEARKEKAWFIGSQWRTCITMASLAKHLFGILKNGRERERLRRKRKLAATRIAIRFQSYQKYKGPTVEYRSAVDIRMGLSLIAKFMQESAAFQRGQVEEREKAEQLLIQVLQDSREVVAIQSRINSVLERITNIQRVWKTYLKKKEGFFELLKRVWIRNSVNMFKNVVMPRMRKNYTQKEKLSYLNNFDIKNNEYYYWVFPLSHVLKKRRGQENFVESYYRICINKYDEKYAKYREGRKGINQGERFAREFLEFLQNRAAGKDDIIELPTTRKRTISIIQEIENNEMEASSSAGSMVLATKPPRLFVLPNIKDIEGLMADCIENILVETIFPKTGDKLAKALSKFKPKISFK